MAEGYSRERLDIFNALLKERKDIVNGRLWMLEPKGLRFKHGESIAELKIPYHMGAEDEARIEDAVLGLVALLMKRYESAETAKAKLPHVKISNLTEKTYRTDLFIAESFEKNLAEEILEYTPFIDSAVLACWLGPEGPGRKFVKWMAELFEKGIKEEAQFGGEERTVDLLLLASIKSIRKIKDKLKEFRIKGLSYERLDLTVGLTIFITFKNTLNSLVTRLNDVCASCYNPLSELLLVSAAVPKSFLAIPSNMLSVTLNPYGVNQDTFDAISSVAIDIDETTKDVSGLIDLTAQKAQGNSDVLEMVKNNLEILQFRHEALRYMKEFDLPGTETQALLYELYSEDRLIKNFLRDPKAPAKIVSDLETIRKKVKNDIHRSGVISGFQDFLSTFKQSMLGGLFKSAKTDTLKTMGPLIEGYYAYRIDDHIERFRGLMRGYLIDRRGEYKQNVLIEEYNRGRLYRFSTDNRPVLKTLEIEEEGQLFVDMKDFSKKTLKVKEIAMAEFMKEYFYNPILRAAAKYVTGTGVVEDERGIRLTNIPGDAAIFSGGVSNLVMLARDIEQIISRYRQQLANKLPPRNDEEVLGEVHRRFQARREDLKERRKELTRSLEKSEEGVEKKLIALGEEEHRLENTYRDELETAIKSELEAGLYISYGAKAETMFLDSKDEFSGPVKVSVGEKINEAARGTDRNSMVRARLEVLLSAEKQRRNVGHLKYPFGIYIDRSYSLRMPPEIENAFEKMISTRKLLNAQALAKLVAEEYLIDLKNVISGAPFSSLRLITSNTNIYNKGQAMSRGALEAYIKENRGAKRFFRKVVRVEELNKTIQDAFFFPSDPLELRFGVDVREGREKVEAFYRCGEITFKGFEAGTPVVIYEMLSAESEFFKALMAHHFEGWLKESLKDDHAESF